MPILDSEVWELGGGYLNIDGQVAYDGSFDTLEVAHATNPQGDTFVAVIQFDYFVFAANRDPLQHAHLERGADRILNTTEPTTVWHAYDPLGTSAYDVVERDAAILGSLTLTGDVVLPLEFVPLGERYLARYSGVAHLVYDSDIPEPGTGVLLMTGLLGLAYRQRPSRGAPRN